MSNTCQHSRHSKQLRGLDKRLGLLVLRSDGTAPGCHSPFQYSSDGEDGSEDGKSPQGSKQFHLHNIAALVRCAHPASPAGSPLPSVSSGSSLSFAKVVVSPMPACRVQSANAQWLRLFGFSSSDVHNKSLRIASGPQTKMQVLSQMCKTATERASDPESVTLYTKAGEELSIFLRATLEPDGNISLGMQSLDAAWAPDEDLEEEEAAVHLSSQGHAVARANAACEALLGVTEARLQAHGMAAVFSEGTSHMRWNNLVKGAAEGATRSCLMTLKAGMNREIVVEMEVELHLEP